MAQLVSFTPHSLPVSFVSLCCLLLNSTESIQQEIICLLRHFFEESEEQVVGVMLELAPQTTRKYQVGNGDFTVQKPGSHQPD